MLEEDLFKSEEWQKATPAQRHNFIAKLQANKRIAKDVQTKKERQDAGNAALPKKKLTNKQKRRSKLGAKRNNGFLTKPSKALSTKPHPHKVAGIDVTSTGFLSTYEWRKTRMVALKKYGARCQCCGASAANGVVIHVDHIKPRKLFPHLALDVENLQVLCEVCNHGKGNWDMTDWREPQL